MKDLKLIYNLELNGEKELINKLSRVNKNLEDSKKGFQSLKEEIKTGVNYFGFKTAEKELLSYKNNLKSLLNEQKKLNKELAIFKKILEQNSGAEAHKTSLKNLAEQYNNLRKEIGGVSSSAEKQKDSIGSLTSNYNKLRKELNNVASRTKKQKDSIGSLTSNYNKLRKELNSVSSGADKQKNSIDSLSSSYNRLKKEINGVNSLSEKQKNNIGSLSSGYNNLRKEIGSINDSSNALYLGKEARISSVTKSLDHLILRYVSLHAAMTNISSLSKEVFHLSDAVTLLDIELGKGSVVANKIVDDLSKLNTRTTLLELVDIANIAKQAGVKENFLVGVTSAIDKIKIAFGEDFGSIKKGTADLVKLVNIFEGTDKVNEESLLRVGNAIRTIANSSVATVPYINDFSKRMTGVKGISDMSLPSVIGLASGFQQFGQSAEVASTALIKIIPQIASNTEKYSKIAGMTKDAFKDLLKDKPEEALLRISEGLLKGKDSVEEISKALADSNLGKGRISLILSTMGDHANDFRQAIEMAKEAYSDVGNIMEAFEKKNNNLAARLDKVKKQFLDLANNENVKNLFSSVTNSLLIFVKVLTSIPFSVVITGVSLLTGAWGYYKGVAIAAYLATKWNNSETLLGTIRNAAYRLGLVQTAAATSSLTAATTGATVAQRGLNAALMANPLGVILGLISALIPWLLTMANETHAAADEIDYFNQKLLTMEEAQRAIAYLTKKATDEKISKIRLLIDVLKDENSSLVTRKKAYEELIKISPRFEGTVDSEYRSTKKLNEAYTSQVKLLEKVARAKAIQSLISNSADKITKAELKVFEIESKMVEDKNKYLEKIKKGSEIDKLINSLKLSTATASFQKNRADANKELADANKEYENLQKFFNKQKDNVKNLVLSSFSSDEKPVSDITDNKKTKGSSIKSAEKTFLSNLEAQRDKELAIARKQWMLREIDEKEYLNRILAINIEFLDKKRLSIKGKSEQELRDIALIDEEKVKLSKETSEKIYNIDKEAIKNKYDSDLNKLNKEFENIKNSPKFTEVEKIDAERDFLNKSLNLRRIYNIEMLSLESQCNVESAKEAKKRAQELIEIENSTYNKLLTNSSERLSKQIDGLRRFSKDINNSLEKEANNEIVELFNKNKGKKDVSSKEKEISDNLKIERLKQDIFILKEIIKLYNEKKEKEGLSKKEEEDFSEEEKYLSERKKELKNYLSDYNKDVKLYYKSPKEAFLDGLKRSRKKISVGKSKDGKNIDGSELASEVLSQGYDLAKQAMESYFETERQNIERNKSLALDRLEKERTSRILFAQSSDEVEAINRESEEKKKEIDRKAFEDKKNLKKKELEMNLASELSAIAISAANNILNGVTFGAAGIAMYAALSGMAFARFQINKANIDKLQYGRGGRLKGPPHKENNGMPVINPSTGEVQAYVEGNEGIINSRSMLDKNRYTLSGTISQIASGINSLGGGISWDRGANISKHSPISSYSYINPPIFSDSTVNKDSFLEEIKDAIIATNMLIQRETMKKVYVSSREIYDVNRDIRSQKSNVIL